METKLDFNKIKNQLPHGAQTEIAKMANVTHNTVHLVLNGKSNNIDVLNAIADYMENLKGKKDAAVGRIASLMN